MAHSKALLKGMSRLNGPQSLLLTFPRTALGANFSEFEERGIWRIFERQASMKRGKLAQAPRPRQCQLRETTAGAARRWDRGTEPAERGASRRPGGCTREGI